MNPNNIHLTEDQVICLANMQTALTEAEGALKALTNVTDIDAPLWDQLQPGMEVLSFIVQHLPF